MDASSMTWESLSPPYATIVVDPPWPYEGEYARPAGYQRASAKRAFLPYSMMSLEDIAALPVADLAAPGAHLYLWATNQFLRQAFDIAELWGFTPVTTLVWCKEPSGKGPGGRFAVTTEFAIYAYAPEWRPPRAVERAGALIRTAREAAGLTRGEVFHRVRGGKKTGLVSNWEMDVCLPTERDWQRLQEVLPALAEVPRPAVPPPPSRDHKKVAKVDTTWWQWSRGAHSEKPAAFLDVVEQVSPGPYVELFARQPRLGWDSWGWGYEQAGQGPVPVHQARPVGPRSALGR